MMNPDSDTQHKLSELIKDIRFAMFTTRGANGQLHSRPMTTQRDEEAGPEQRLLWFFMSRSGEPVSELTAEPSVNVSYSDPDKDAYVSVSGRARVVEDQAVKERLWSKMNEAWFPNGVTDPDLALVCVEIAQAEYWNVKESKMVQLFKMAKAAMTGHPPTDMGEHART